MLKPQDIVILLKLVALDSAPWAYGELAKQLGMSASEVHAAIKRCLSANLAIKQDQGIVPNHRNLLEFLVHGMRYVFPPERGELTRGISTAYAAEPLAQYFAGSTEPPPIWPDAEGDTRGITLKPLYKSVPFAAKNDNQLYELLALVDAIRIGRARERQLAIRELTVRLVGDSEIAHAS